VSEQIEEMDKAWNLVNLLEVYGTDRLALALLDHQLAEYL
jgi:ferritin